MTEPTVQVPVSLIERVRSAIRVGYGDMLHPGLIADLDALFPQPTPSVLPHFCTPGCTNDNCPVEPLTAAEAAELRTALAERGLTRPAEPPSIADMVPEKLPCADPNVHRWFCQRHADGVCRLPKCIDPSTTPE